jgi:hypothetical protein
MGRTPDWKGPARRIRHRLMQHPGGNRDLVIAPDVQGYALHFEKLEFGFDALEVLSLVFDVPVRMNMNHIAGH